MKGIYLSIVCASGLGLMPVQDSVFAGEQSSFASPAAEQSYAESGDISQLPSDQDFVMDIDANTTTHQWGRSTGCSTGCSVGCSTGCSMGCSVGCRRW